MSSEEMRVELESFVNAGLREGWRGWPLKEETSTGRISNLPLRGKMAGFWCKRDCGLIAFGGRLAAGIANRLCFENQDRRARVRWFNSQ
jgi:hypothetical protein